MTFNHKTKTPAHHITLRHTGGARGRLRHAGLMPTNWYKQKERDAKGKVPESMWRVQLRPIPTTAALRTHPSGI